MAQASAQKIWVIEPQLEEATTFVNGLARAKKNGLWGFIDKAGNWVVKPEFTRAWPHTEGLALVQHWGKVGFIDTTGQWVIEPLLENVSGFSEGLAPAQKWSKYGFINQTGKWAIEDQFEEVGGFADGLAMARQNGKAGFIDRTGTWVIQPQFGMIWGFAEGLALAQHKSKWGYIDRTGQWAIQPQFEWASDFVEDLARAQHKGRWGFIDKTGKWVVEPQFEELWNFAEGLAATKKANKWGFIDKTGQWIIQPQFDDIYGFAEGVAPAKQAGKWGFIDKTGQWVIQPQFDAAGGFAEGLAAVKHVSKWGYIELPIHQQFKNRLQAHMRQWSKKGKYEKELDYQGRVTTANQQKEADKYLLNLFGERFSSTPAMSTEYDTENESFKIMIKDVEPMFLKVPIAEAEAFDQAIVQKKMLLSNVHYWLTDKNIALRRVSFTNQINDKQYEYDAQDLVAFQPETYTPAKVHITLPQTQAKPAPPTPVRYPSPVSELEVNLPKSRSQNPEAIAVVIGNSAYQKTKAVDFAVQDARSIRKYLIEVLGYREGNILYYENATRTDFETLFGSKDNEKGKLYNSIRPSVSEVFVYYSGHGAPGLNTKEGYFVPVECEPQYVELGGYSTEIFYNNLSKLPAKSVQIVLDACFSGANIFENISPIIIKSKGAEAWDKGVLITSSSEDEVSGWYNEKGHGLFTYFFLKGIHSGAADKNQDKKITFSELYDYISDNAYGVPYYARKLHNITQTPALKGRDKELVVVEYE